MENNKEITEEEYIKMWENRFIELRERKPTRLEKTCFTVGFNAGKHGIWKTIKHRDTQSGA